MSSLTTSPSPRRRGAQPGNRNALKHGAYSRHPTPQLRRAYLRARRRAPSDLADEIATVRARLAAFHAATPATDQASVALLNVLVRTLSQLVALHYRTSGQAGEDLGANIAAVLQGTAAQLWPTEGPPRRRTVLLPPQ